MIRLNARIVRGRFKLDVRFETEARVAGLFGPSGCGKTTLLQAIAGLLIPRDGSIVIDGQALYSSERRINAPPNRRRTGYVFQDDRLFPHMNVRKNLLAGRSRPSAAPAGPDLEEVVELLGLESLMDRSVSALSGGEARRVAIGRALLTNPRLLLLDEPLTGLDADFRRRILAYLLRLRRSLNVRMLYVSHTVADFLTLVDDMAIIRDGAVVATGSPTDLLARAVDEVEAGPLETTVTGSVETVDPQSGEARVRCDGVVLTLSLPQARAGDEAFLSVGAHEVLLGVGPMPVTSARNRLTARVLRVAPTPTRVLVCVDVGWPLWAELTHRAASELGLVPGSEVYALLKARSIRGVTLPSARTPHTRTPPA